MFKTIKYKQKIYPEFQAKGNASKFIMPFAREILKGEGVDIGCNRKEWAFPGAQPIDILFNDPWDAYNLPSQEYDYIYSSHCLEHLEDWVGALDYWKSCLKKGGVIFLYLPHFDQEYWRPWNNRKHIHVLDPCIIEKYFIDQGFSKVFITKGYDAYSSFTCIVEL
jgi:SAM-dependent methyltransferase